MSTPQKNPPTLTVIQREELPCCVELRGLRGEIAAIRSELAELRAATPSVKEKYALIAAFIVGVVGKIIEKNYGITIPVIP